MASLELRNNTYRVVFMLGGRKHGYSLQTRDRSTAEALRGGVEKTLMLLGQGLLTIPDGVDAVSFVRTGGKVTAPPQQPTETPTFALLRNRYLETHSHGAMENTSLDTIKLHLRHLAKTFGERRSMDKLTLADVQRHVDRRLGVTFRGKPIGAVTIRKEVTTFRAMWNWCSLHGFVTGPFPSIGLVYPKTEEKPRFMTLHEAERKVARGGLTKFQIDAVWEAVYLRREDLEELLEYVRRTAAYPWIYPMICVAAHTGARRSELLRAEVTDVDVTDSVLTVREKKRNRKQRTTRQVSMTPFLARVLGEWLAVHPGGRYLFCQAGLVERSKKRGKTTGHRSGEGRPTRLKERIAGLRPQPRPGVDPLTKNEAHDHFKRTLAGSRWEVVRGFHVLRHSFISCLAAAGVDQRIIDDFTGHSTDQQRVRYRHLLPEVKQKAIAQAFGSR